MIGVKKYVRKDVLLHVKMDVQKDKKIFNVKNYDLYDVFFTSCLT